MSEVVTKLSWMEEELSSGKFNTEYKIDQNAPFKFTFNDNAILMKRIQSVIKNYPAICELYNSGFNLNAELSATKLWLRTEETIIPMTLMDLYNTFVSYLKDDSFEDQLFNCHEISFLSPMGPFTTIPLVQCLNQTIIEKFIFKNLISNKLPLRNFRVHTEGRVLMSHGENFEEVVELDFCQITDTGILLSADDEMLLQAISKTDYLKVFIDTTKLNDFVDADLRLNLDLNNKDLFYTEDDLRYFFIEEGHVSKSLSYSSGETGKFYLFFRYHNMLESDVPNVFLRFVEKTKSYFKELIAA